MSSDIRSWIIETIAFKIATRHYDLQKSNGDLVGEISTEATLDAISVSWPDLAKQIRNYLDGYYPEYKRGRDFGQLSVEQKQIIEIGKKVTVSNEYTVRKGMNGKITGQRNESARSPEEYLVEMSDGESFWIPSKFLNQDNAE